MRWTLGDRVRKLWLQIAGYVMRLIQVKKRMRGLCRPQKHQHHLINPAIAKQWIMSLRK
jgi:hypothetical protein